MSTTIQGQATEQEERKQQWNAANGEHMVEANAVLRGKEKKSKSHATTLMYTC